MNASRLSAYYLRFSTNTTPSCYRNCVKSLFLIYPTFIELVCWEVLGKHSSILEKVCRSGRWASGSSSVVGREELCRVTCLVPTAGLCACGNTYHSSSLQSPQDYAFVLSLPTPTWQLSPRSLMPALLCVGNVLGTVAHTSTSTQCPIFRRLFS